MEFDQIAVYLANYYEAQKSIGEHEGEDEVVLVAEAGMIRSNEEDEMNETSMNAPLYTNPKALSPNENTSETLKLA